MRKINITLWLLVILVIFLSVLLLKNKNNNRISQYTSDTIMEKISFIQDLSLVKYNYSGVISYKDYKKFMSLQVPLTEKAFLIKYSGYVRAGIDMKSASVRVQGKTIWVYLPKPEVQETVIDEKSIAVFDESMNILNPISVTDYQKAIVGEKNKITANAVAKGILTESSDQAHQVVRNFLTELGFETVFIEENGAVFMPDKAIDK